MTGWDFLERHPIGALLWALGAALVGGYLLFGLAFVLASAQARYKARNVTIAVEGEESAATTEGRPS